MTSPDKPGMSGSALCRPDYEHELARRPAIRHPVKLARQAAYLRAHGDDAAAEGIADELAEVGCCRVCGRVLTDPLSVERGIGPSCWAASRGAGEP